ncbi:hypothetical protein Agub_g12356 [Astrephomene gubernaculifera]|uniref:Protein kinase domain-containing protein n=1 Tax=Astrephomene gubernaculifera TaxID=47775 RepID=A0AAD3DY42_9CHLO|nr:hypothetical protein Agub_g12356 [Astrephomene gubernaculifera]
MALGSLVNGNRQSVVPTSRNACERRLTSSLRPRHRNIARPVPALGEAASQLDVATTTAASELIARSLQYSGTDVSHLLSHLNHALDGSNSLFHTTHHVHADLNAAITLVEPEALHHVGSWAQGSAINDVVASAAPVLADVVASPHTALAADAASAMAVDAAHASVLALATWAGERLATIATIDPESYGIMRDTLDEVLAAIQGVVDSQTGGLVLGWTNALVLGVQQLVTTLRLSHPEATSTIDSMLAAQQAMHETLMGGPGPMGTRGAAQVAMMALALLVAAIPRGGQAALAAGAGVAASSSAFGIPSGPSQQQAGGLLGSPAATAADGLPLRYDPKALDSYFAQRPMQVLRRNAQVFSRIGGFCVRVLWDWRTGVFESNMDNRAKEAGRIIEDLGPAYIKIAQQLSTRVDLVPPPYLEEFKRLQDNVRTFSTVEAREVLESGLGCSVDRVFEWLSAEPLAAASLGQVYRGKLRPEHGSVEVAVKVQRPAVLETVALDIYIMRRAAILMSKMPGMSDQWAVVLDDWATRFFEEMDYQLEAHNTMAFKQQMASLQGISVATVYPQFTSRKVIVTEWVEGEKLNQSKAEDVRALCSTLLNCYLIQLLETGLLHADPHPGNLLRTADGKIVILDFGLMTEVTEDQRVALIEFIAHLTMEDWKGVAKDLLALGFFPDGMPREAEQMIAPVLETVMGQIVRGGGLKNFNIGSVSGQLQGVAMNYKMCIPPYFGLVLRAFCVIEGIALKTDENYAIVHECLPYLSRRLLTDNNPRMRAALRHLLYGKKNRLDIERLSKMVSAFGSFTTNSATAQASGPTFGEAAERGFAERVKGHNGSGSGSGGLLSDGPVVNEATREVLKVVFAKDGSYAQELIVEEMVAAVDAMSREALGEALRLVLSSAGAVTALRSVEALGPLRSMLMPLPLPLEVLSAMAPTVTLTADDRQALAMVRTLLDLLQPSMSRLPDVATTSGRAIRAAGELMPMVPELLPGMRSTLELFIRQLVRRMALRLAEDLAAPGGGGSSRQQQGK